jgi:hypothetical protein
VSYRRDTETLAGGETVGPRKPACYRIDDPSVKELCRFLSPVLPRDLPKDVLEAFGKAGTFDLYALDPSKVELEGKGFRGWTVPGKTTLPAADAKTAFDVVRMGGAGRI